MTADRMGVIADRAAGRQQAGAGADKGDEREGRGAPPRQQQPAHGTGTAAGPTSTRQS